MMIEFDLDRPWKYMEDDENTEILQECSTDLESLIRYTHPYEIFPGDLEKRTRAIVDLLSNPKSNKKYNTDQAISLGNSCLRANRPDLAQIIQKALSK